ncbi:MAG: beta-galactosidase [Parcubacteria group bacterium]
MAFLLVFLFFVLIIFVYFFVGSIKPAEKITWGMNFSQKHARDLGLDWKETYSAMLSDLGVKNLKVAAHWDLLEPKENEFYFDDLDWQINEASNYGAKILLVIGMKTPRWPECHIPDWAKNLSKTEQQEEILKMLKEVVLRYKDSKVISRWQVENEPFFPFGDCPWVDKEFFKKEVSEVRSLDPLGRPVLIGENGESFWFTAAKIGDIVGTTMYRKVWFSAPHFLKKYLGPFKEFGFYLKYPWPPTFYGRKAKIIEKLFGKKVIGVELQAEPWCQNLLYDCLADEQKKTMNLKQLQDNIEFAKKTGFDEFYLWGSEWIYWLKKNQNDSTIWDEVRELF